MVNALRLSKYHPVIFGASYARKILSIQRANLVAYWPLWEASGAVAYDQSGNAIHGAYTGVTLRQPGIGDGKTCPYFDGANDVCNIYSAGLNAAVNMQEFSVSIWMKMLNVGVWTDGSNRNIIRLLSNPASNDFYVQKNANNQIAIIYRANSTTDFVSDSGRTETTWLHYAITVSLSSDEFKAYRNGSQIGATQTGLGTWSGALASTGCAIGAVNTTPTTVMHGWLAHAAIWTTPLTAPEIAKLAQV